MNKPYLTLEDPELTAAKWAGCFALPSDHGQIRKIAWCLRDAAIHLTENEETERKRVETFIAAARKELTDTAMTVIRTALVSIKETYRGLHGSIVHPQASAELAVAGYIDILPKYKDNEQLSESFNRLKAGLWLANDLIVCRYPLPQFTLTKDKKYIDTPEYVTTCLNTAPLGIDAFDNLPAQDTPVF